VLLHGEQDAQPAYVEHEVMLTVAVRNRNYHFLFRLREAGPVPPSSRTGAAAAITVLLWGCAFVAIRVAVPALGPAGLSLGRLAVASLALAVLAPLLRVRRPAAGDLPRIVVCGALGMTAYQLLLNAGERSVPAGTASLLVGTAPLFAALLAWVVLSERVGRRTLSGAAVGFAGACVMATSGGNGLGLDPGAVLVLGAAVVQAGFFVAQKPLLARYRATEVTCYAMWAGTLLALPLLPWTARALPRLDAASLAALLFLGLAASAIGFATWAYASARVSVAAAAASLYAVPVVALVVGWVALGERPHAVTLAGGALALAGVALARSSPARAGSKEPQSLSRREERGRPVPAARVPRVRRPGGRRSRAASTRTAARR
jgi:drug/metabolite transporter (DMT)-like permease